MNLEFIAALVVGFSIGWLFAGFVIIFIFQRKHPSDRKKELEELLTEIEPQDLAQIARLNVIAAAYRAPFDVRLSATIKVLEFYIEYIEIVIHTSSEEDFSEKEAELIFEFSRLVSVLKSELEVFKNHQLDFELKKYSDN